MLTRLWQRLQTRRCPVWYHPAYRLPLPGVQARSGLDRRRADLVMWWLEDAGLIGADTRRTPERITWADLAQVHGEAWLERSCSAEGLAGVFAVEPMEVPVDALLESVRLACGGTLAAAREALERGGPCLNLSGGFHHAKPLGGGGFCVYNDIAVAIARLRADGVGGRIGVLDLDAHPPDGTRACRGALGAVWVGSISGSGWGELAGEGEGWAEEILLPGAADGPYLAALDGLLARAPRCDLWMVLAGGDVLAGDPLGRLGLSVAGALERDRRVAARLAGRPSVWLPGGGYREDAWRVLAGTAWVLMRPGTPEIPERLDPLAHHFRRVARQIPAAELGSDDIDLSDVAAELGMAPEAPARFLGFYTRAGMEYALERLGILEQIRRLGYSDLEVDFAAGSPGELFTLTGRFRPAAPPGSTSRRDPGPPIRARLVEVALERQILPSTPAHPAGLRVLFVHWLSLQHPAASFDAGRPRLPGQERPGLGLAREAGALLARVAERLGLEGVALRPAWFHVAWASRARFRFVDPEVQARFLVLARDLPGLFPGAGSAGPAGAGFDLAAASRAVAEGEIGIGRAGAEILPFAWAPEVMISDDPARLAALQADPGLRAARVPVAGYRDRHDPLVAADP